MRALAFGWVLLALACSTNAAGDGGPISVTIKLTTSSLESGRRVQQSQSFSLTCNPTGGTLPLADRICGDIARYPRAMLDPRYAQRVVCGALMEGPSLSVVATVGGRATRFGGQPVFCEPGGVGLVVYDAAVRQDTQTLDLIEPRLRCDEDDFLFSTPTPTASVVACVRGLWTPRAEVLIRTATQLPSLAAIQAAQIFPTDPGAEPCTIDAGGPGPGRTLEGDCGVSLKNVWSSPTVSFVENWPVGAKTARHVWHVTVANGVALLASQSGPVPPQLWR